MSVVKLCMLLDTVTAFCTLFSVLLFCRVTSIVGCQAAFKWCQLQRSHGPVAGMSEISSCSNRGNYWYTSNHGWVLILLYNVERTAKSLHFSFHLHQTNPSIFKCFQISVGRFQKRVCPCIICPIDISLTLLPLVQLNKCKELSW